MGRVAICPGRAEYGGSDPFFLIASEADGCYRVMGGEGFTIANALDEADRANGMTTPRFPAAADAFAGGEGRREGRRGALIFSESSRGGLPLEVPLPSHISFLWAESNEAMVRLLSPLIPVAKALGLFLLDFDVYTERRDAEPTARLVVPAVRRFFHTWR